jgi:hypothetical protein
VTMGLWLIPKIHFISKRRQGTLLIMKNIKLKILDFFFIKILEFIGTL